MTVTEIWQDLLGRPASEVSTVRRQLETGGAAQLYAGVEYPRATPLLLLRTPRGTSRTMTALPQAGGFAVQWLKYSDAPEHEWLVVALLDSAHLEIFGRLATDITAWLGTAGTPRQAAHGLLERVREWQAFLRQRGQGLDESARQGLFGELWLFRDWLTDGLPGDGLLQAWQGPQGAAQDFRLAQLQVEVKTTGTTSARVKISSLEQLEPSLGRLMLARVALDRAAEGTTLPELVQAVRGLLDEAQGHRLTSLLRQVGYDDRDAPLYEEAHYVVAQLQFYEVDDTFPRLRRREVPQGITAVQYTIDLSTCSSHLRPQHDLRRWLGEHFEHL
ncbi:PD-(D/E)XK motif protein [Deinococcus hohokamensis]|uniref:PD-(D/E)XK motif protein n=1 Tax=Deinococcus hohokamensis TaxID=309883 RepID=A0ABV9ICG0_9DEIO